LETGFASRLEVQRPLASSDGWSLAFVVPECEFLRFGEASVLDLLDLASEIEESVLRDHAA